MIKQDFSIPANHDAFKTAGGKNHLWEVRHAGLLGIKYEVAVRGDLFDQGSVKQEDSEFVDNGKVILRGVVDAAVLGYVNFKS